MRISLDVDCPKCGSTASEGHRNPERDMYYDAISYEAYECLGCGGVAFVSVHFMHE